MLYKLLGILVWNGAKVLLRRRYGSLYMPKPVFAGIVLVGVGGVALAAALAKRNGSEG